MPSVRTVWPYLMVVACVAVCSAARAVSDRVDSHLSPDVRESAATQEPEFSRMSLDELLGVVVTPTKRGQRADQAPAIVAVVTADDIAERGYRTVAEALSHIPGLAVVDDLVHQHVGVRGLYSESESPNGHLKILLNNQPINFRSTSGSFLGRELVPISMVKRIEVIRGPGSALYGANALMGVINIMTFDGDDFAHGLVESGVSGTVMPLQTRYMVSANGGGTLLLGGQWNKLRYALGGTFDRTDRSGLDIPGHPDMITGRFYRTDPEYNEPPFGFPSPGWDAATRERLLRNSPSRNDIALEGSLYGVASYAVADELMLRLDGNFQYLDKYGEFQGFSALTHANRTSYKNYFSRLRLEWRGEATTGWSASVALTFAGGSPTSAESMVDPIRPSSRIRRDFGYKALDGALMASYAFSSSHALSLGVDLSVDREDLIHLRITELSGGTADTESFGRKNFVNAGFYGQWVWSPWEGLGITVGTRVDHNNQIACDGRQVDCFGHLADANVRTRILGSETVKIEDRGVLQNSSRVGVVYAFPWDALYVKVAWGSSYKPPSPFQLYHRPLSINSSRGRPDLRPQTADTVELLLGRRAVDWWRCSINGYYTKVNDMVLFLKEEGIFEGRNADVMLMGIEAEAEVRPDPRFSAYVNVGLPLRMEVSPKRRHQETDAAWDVSVFNDHVGAGMYPDWSVNTGGNLRFEGSRINLNVNARFVGARAASLGNNQLFDAVDLKRTYKLPGYVMLDLTLSSVGLRWLGNRETLISASLRGLPGGQVDPGFGGVDLPTLGPQLLLTIRQAL